MTDFFLMVLTSNYMGFALAGFALAVFLLFVCFIDNHLLVCADCGRYRRANPPKPCARCGSERTYFIAT